MLLRSPLGYPPDVGYRWVKKAGLSAQRATPRIYTDAEKAEFFRLLVEQGNVSAVARQLGFVRVTCYKWAHQAGILLAEESSSNQEPQSNQGQTPMPFRC